jgi:WD40 repeat protein
MLAIVWLTMPLAVLGTGCTPLPRVPLANPWVRARSQDELHVAWAQRTADGKAVVAVDGKVQSKEYEEIGVIVFSPDNQRVAYWVKNGEKWRMVVNEEPGLLEFDEISINDIAFSPDGKRLAYSARREKLWFAVLDGKVIADKGYVALHDLTFSPDSRRLAYAAVKGDKQTFVIDGIVGPSFTVVSDPLWSPDSRHFAYIASDNSYKFIILDGGEGKKYDGVNTPVFSNDSRHFAYGAIKSEKRLVVTDGKEGPEFEMRSPIDSIKFAPSDDRIGYAANKGDRGKWVIVIDGKEGPEYDDIATSSLAFNPAGRGFAYAAAQNGGWRVIDERGEGPLFDAIAGGPVYSPDGRHIVYGASLRNRWVLSVDGQAGAEFDYNEITALSFSPDGKHLMYKASKNGLQLVVVDGCIGPEYNRVYKPAFTKGGVEYLAERESDGWMLRGLIPYAPENKKIKPAESVKAVETKLSWLPPKEPTEGKCGPCENQKALLKEQNEEARGK